MSRFSFGGVVGSEDALLRKMQSADRETRKQAAWAAIERSNPTLETYMVKGVLGDESDAGVREAYVYALGNLSNRRHFAAIENAIDTDPSGYVRSAAWLAAARIDPRQFQTLADTRTAIESPWDRLGRAQAWLYLGDVREVGELLAQARVGDQDRSYIASRALHKWLRPLLDAAGRWPLDGDGKSAGVWSPEFVDRISRICSEVGLQAVSDDTRKHEAAAGASASLRDADQSRAGGTGDASVRRRLKQGGWLSDTSGEIFWVNFWCTRSVGFGVGMLEPVLEDVNARQRPIKTANDEMDCLFSRSAQRSSEEDTRMSHEYFAILGLSPGRYEPKEIVRRFEIRRRWLFAELGDPAKYEETRRRLGELHRAYNALRDQRRQAEYAAAAQAGARAQDRLDRMRLLIESSLEDGLLRYSRRAEILAEGARLGYSEFHTQLLIAQVQFGGELVVPPSLSGVVRKPEHTTRVGARFAAAGVLALALFLVIVRWLGA